jgi:hypothetical protein
VDVTAYDTVTKTPILLGSIATQIWTNGFKSSEDRELQVVKFFRAPAPVVFDRITVTEDFAFAAGRSFAEPHSIGQALIFLGTHRDAVPNVAHILFSADGSTVWLAGCGIQRIELVDKKGALIVFGYHIVAGVWTLTKPF